MPVSDDFSAEAAPLLRHAGIASILLLGFAVIGLAVRGLESLMPTAQAELAMLERVDVWYLLVLFCAFAAYTAIILFMRMWRGFLKEAARTFPKLSETSSNTSQGREEH